MKPDHDVVVVGAGMGGLYGVYRFNRDGLDVLGLEAARDVGGVWLHNAYPGARVDVESIDYCYYFSPELYRDWKWSERYASQPEILGYLNHVADRFDIRRHFRFGQKVVSAQWDEGSQMYHIATDKGLAVTCRYLVMATGQLSAPRQIPFQGLDDFGGEWAMTSRWPEGGVDCKGKRVAVIGTGSSGVQVTTALAPEAAHLYLFHRSPNYSVPAWNGPIDQSSWQSIADRVESERHRMMYEIPGTHARFGSRPLAECSESERQEILEAAWAGGGHGMSYVFSDQGLNKSTNDFVAAFVKDKITEKLADKSLADVLCDFDHPIGTRRLVVDTGYYESFNRDNVTLVNIRGNGIDRITPAGLRLADGTEYEVDVILFALGFEAFMGALNSANIHNADDLQPADRWRRGPRTLYGLMTCGFPNLFLPTGPGSPSVLGNFFIQNELLMDWIADCIVWMKERGLTRIEPEPEAEEAWTAHCAEMTEPILRRQVENYMVHVNDDGSRIFIPYIGGVDRFAREIRASADAGYEGFRFESASHQTEVPEAIPGSRGRP